MVTPPLPPCAAAQHHHPLVRRLCRRLPLPLSLSRLLSSVHRTCLGRLVAIRTAVVSTMIRPAARAAACAFLSSSPSRNSPPVPPKLMTRRTILSPPPELSAHRAARFGASSADYTSSSSCSTSSASSAATIRKRSYRSTPQNSASAVPAASEADQNAGEGTGSGEGVCSSRGRAAPSLLPVYLTDARAVARYHPQDSPDGALQLSVAENQMLEDLLVPAIERYSRGGEGVLGENEAAAAARSFFADQIYYQPTHGRRGLREATAAYLRRILSLEGEMDADGLVLGAGCNAVLENLCLCLAERGDAVLVPTPYYAAFEFDLVARAALQIVPVKTMEHSGVEVDMTVGTERKLPVPAEAYYPTRASLDAGYDLALERGCPPRILLLSHPNNPLGVCYPPDVVRECIDWCRERRIHLISDEIYAGSVYKDTTDNGERTFISALNIARGHDAGSASGGAGLGLGPYVHFVYALSKDFALSGLRVGAAYSENQAIRLSMQKLNDLCQISSQTQLLIERMLSSTVTVTGGGGCWSTDEFLPENRRCIRDRCDRLADTLDAVGVPYLPADSGLFVWMDMREFLPPVEEDATSSPIGRDGAESQESMERRERSLYLTLLNEHGLLLTPGMSMRNELPGFFRCVFTAASDREFDLGLERIERCVVTMRKRTL